MLDKELSRLINDPNFLQLYDTAINALVRSGIINSLLLLGQPKVVFEGKDVNAQAIQAAWACGWNEALNTLFGFEKILDAFNQPKTSPRMSYGGLSTAVERGDILEEERYAIEHGLRIDPAIYKPKPTPTKAS